MTITTKMQRGGVVFDHFGIGPLRLRVHVRIWRPMLYVCWGLRGGYSHGICLGKY